MTCLSTFLNPALQAREDKQSALAVSSGLYGLENILYGGKTDEKVFVKYNPYKLETEITVEGKRLAQNSKLGEKVADGSDCRIG